MGKCISEKCAHVTGTPPARVEGLALAVKPNPAQQACGGAEPCTEAPRQWPRAGREGANELLALVTLCTAALLGAPGALTFLCLPSCALSSTPCWAS